MNSVIEDLPHQPFLDLLAGLSRWTIGNSFKRREMSKKWIELRYRLIEFEQAHHIKFILPCNVLFSLLTMKGLNGKHTFHT
jgi:hypothetical protein